MTRSKRRSRLVVQHLEGISGATFDEFPEVIREFTRGRNGVYALYKKDRLYYVGLARNLRSRLRGHMRDRHAGRWNRFSVYLTEGDEHLKELESLVLRIASPRGNRVTGKFIDSEDLKRRFRARMKEGWERKLSEMTDWAAQESTAAPRPTGRPRRSIGQKLDTVLGKYVSTRFHIRMDFKGKRYVAHVRRNGAISFARESADWQRLRGKLFKSPSAAAVAAVGHAMNGWHCWKFKNKDGQWVKLSELRAGRAQPRL